MTPLQGALVAAAIANNGMQMRPYLIDTLQGSDLTPVDRADVEELRRPVSPEVAAQLREMMNSVVASGTGTNAQIDGFEVGGKTGTAQNGDAPGPRLVHRLRPQGRPAGRRRRRPAAERRLGRQRGGGADRGPGHEGSDRGQGRSELMWVRALMRERARLR